MKARIIMTSHGRGEVWIEGSKINGVRSLAFVADAGHANRLTLTLLVDVLEIEVMDVDVTKVQIARPTFD